MLNPRNALLFQPLGDFFVHSLANVTLNTLDNSKRKLKSFDVGSLDAKGIGRWDEEYYLAGLYHPLRAMAVAEKNPTAITATLGQSPNREVDIYIHVPFCHVNCSFCHFYKEIIPRNKENNLEQAYIGGLLAEIDIYAKAFRGVIQPRTIQFGGGTPSALSVEGLTTLLSGLKERLDLSQLSEVKFEFHPDMANDLVGYRRRLQALRDFGLSTAIIDLEATDAQVLKAISRGNTSYEGFKNLIDIAVEEGVTSIASAYMTGLPCETLESFEKTLRILTSIEHIDAINLYPLMFKPSDAVFRQRRRDPSIFVTPHQKDLMMVLATDILGEAGFVEGPCHFFRKQSHIPKQQIGKAQSKTLLGLGPASFGYIDGPEYGLQYMNYPDLDRYLSAVNSGLVGLWRSSTLNRAQKALRSLLFVLNSFASVSTDLLEQAAQASAPGHLMDVIDTLMELKLLISDTKGVRLTDLGKLRNAEVMFYLSEKSAVRWNVEDPEFDLIRRYEFFPDVSKDNQILFEKQVAARTRRKLAA